MEFWLSRSLSHELFFSFHDGILAIKVAFLTNFFSFQDGILAIKEPFSRTFFSLFTMEFWLSRLPFSRTFSLFMMEFWLSRSLSHELFFLFSRWNSRNTQFGERHFSYIYITKSIYIGSASLKTWHLDLERPLQGKEYGPPYSNATKKIKANVFPEITYRHVIRIFAFQNANLRK
jgi:hypothetical protein